VKVAVLVKTVEGARWSVSPAAELRRRGHQVVFALPGTEGGLPDRVRAAGMDVVVAEAPLMGAGPLRQPAALRRLRRQLVRVLGADVVVSHLFASALAGRLALAGTGVPHVHMSHGPLYLENPAIRAAERVLWHLDAHHIGSSGAMVQAYRRLGMPADRLSLIPNGIPPEWADVARDRLRQEARERLGIGENTFVGVCLALFYAPKRLVHRGRGIKGHDVLLPAWAEYRRRGGTGELLLVGGGFGPGGEEYRAEMQATFGGVPGVHWIGQAPDVRPYLAAADVNIAPSLSENIGSPSEAAFMGLPSIASNVGGLPEVVVDGWTGWLVEPNDVDALSFAIEHAAGTGPAVLARRAAKAHQRAHELHDEAANDIAWADVVEQVAARSFR